MKLEIKKKKALRALICFFLIMFVCTLVSRGIYSARLPQVQVKSLSKMCITHEITADGVLNAGVESAVWTQSDLRVEEVCVHVGDRVSQGDLLFRLNQDSIREKMESIQNEVDQIDAQTAVADSNSQQAENVRQTAIARAQEDRENSIAAADAAIVQAQNEWNAVKAQLDSYESQGIPEGEDSGQWESTHQELIADLNEKQQALSDAQQARQTAEVTADRAIEDAQVPVEQDATDEVSALTKEEKQGELAKYQVLLDAEGAVTAATEGVVSACNVSTGDLTPTGACVLIESAGTTMTFTAQISKDDRQYLEMGDTVSIDFGNDQVYEKGSVERIEPVDDNTGGDGEDSGTGAMDASEYQVSVEVPSDVADMGSSGTMEVVKNSKQYDCCVPLETLYTDGLETYVYVVEESEGILGMEYQVKKQTVRIQEKNNQYAALDDASGLSDEDRLVCYSSKLLHVSDSIRLEEP